MRAQRIRIELDDREQALAVNGVLAELIEPPADATSLFESPGGWTLDAYYLNAPDVSELANRLAAALPFAVPQLLVEPVPDENWVALSQAALPPVFAGRFTVHGSHDRGRVGRGPYHLEIDAGEAFGTAHHATTEGCLMALDQLTRRRAFARVLDLGCGSGVLAIAAARQLPRARVEAIDIDPLAVAVATANARLKGSRSRIHFKTAGGLPPSAKQSEGYDLVLANILAGPLIELAPDLAGAIPVGGFAVLSGVLTAEAPRVRAAYATRGFSLVRHARSAGWSTLTLRRRCTLRQRDRGSIQARGVKSSRARMR